MRERYRLYICPWPRIELAPTDEDALNVTYLGEPKMSLKKAAKARFAGLPSVDCIDCNPRVSVCPTCVDIRLGRQPGCIRCRFCIDACDAVMAKVKRSIRLVGYDIDENLRRRQRGGAPFYRPIRPRALGYAGLIVFLGVLMLCQLASRRHLGLAILHSRARIFTTMRSGDTPNGYTLKLASKWVDASKFAISVGRLTDASLNSVLAASAPEGELVGGDDPDSPRQVDLFVIAQRVFLGDQSTSHAPFAVETIGGESARARDHFFGP